MPTDVQIWKRCSTCKKSIGFRAPHYACSVSTCNRKGTGFAFCTVECWDAHVPLLRHRDAWAVEKTSPTVEEWEREQRAEAARQAPPAAAAPHAADGTSSPGSIPRDVLVVASKLKLYVRAISGMNTSDDVIEVLSERLRLLCDDAVERARDDNRKTVMARDFRRPRATT
jgi:hypothetical protein